MNVSRTGIRLWESAGASADALPTGLIVCTRRACYRQRSSCARSASATGEAHRAHTPHPLPTALIEHTLGVGQRPPTAVQQHEQVVQEVGSLFIDTLVALLARRASDLLGLLHH